MDTNQGRCEVQEGEDLVIVWVAEGRKREDQPEMWVLVGQLGELSWGSLGGVGGRGWQAWEWKMETTLEAPGAGGKASDGLHLVCFLW